MKPQTEVHKAAVKDTCQPKLWKCHYHVSIFVYFSPKFLRYVFVVLLVAHLICNLQVTGSISGWASPCSGLGQATYISVTKQYIWYWPRDSDALQLGR